MTVIGVTGGIGSGKTTFCRYIESRGYPVINADKLAKQLMVADSDLKSAIISRFGEDAYQNDGSLNIEFLAKKAFQENRVEDLNELVHPVVKKAVLSDISSLQVEGVKLVIYEAAIMLNNGRPDYLDVVVWIESESEDRIKRVVKRDGSDPENVKHRMNKQNPIETVREYVDIVINNSGSLSDLENEADKLIQQYVR
jgi:dephospho-CoA kinase